VLGEGGRTAPAVPLVPPLVADIGGAPYAAGWGSCPTYRRSSTTSTPLSSSLSASEGAAASDVQCERAQPGTRKNGEGRKLVPISPVGSRLKWKCPNLATPNSHSSRSRVLRARRSPLTTFVCPWSAGAEVGAPRSAPGPSHTCSPQAHTAKPRHSLQPPRPGIPELRGAPAPAHRS